MHYTYYEGKAYHVKIVAQLLDDTATREQINAIVHSVYSELKHIADDVFMHGDDMLIVATLDNGQARLVRHQKPYAEFDVDSEGFPYIRIYRNTYELTEDKE